ncbi:MAG: DNA alkylation repair protein [Planctomycetota bacterium]
MNAPDVMAKLEKLGKESTRRTWLRHGVREQTFGVAYADLYALQKRVGVDHPLARELWGSGVHDARILATLVADPQACTAKDLDAWVGAAGYTLLADAVSVLAGKSPHAAKLADKWRASRKEWTSAAGWGLVARIAAPGGGATDAWLEERLEEIRAGVGAAPNRTRHAMNTALISIGGYRPALRDRALAVAKAIGKVEVDHGDTDCKTPDAASYIAKMAARASAKKSAPKPKARAKSAAHSR